MPTREGRCNASRWCRVRFRRRATSRKGVGWGRARFGLGVECRSRGRAVWQRKSTRIQSSMRLRVAHRLACLLQARFIQSSRACVSESECVLACQGEAGADAGATNSQPTNAASDQGCRDGNTLLTFCIPLCCPFSLLVLFCARIEDPRRAGEEKASDGASFPDGKRAEKIENAYE